MPESGTVVLPESLSAIEWLPGGSLRLLDQRRLPDQLVYVDCRSAADVARAIAGLVVCGGAAMAVAAAYGIVLAAGARAQPVVSWEQALAPDFALLATARPAAVQLNWVLGIMRETLRRLPAHADVSACLLQTAGSIAEADREANLTMGRLGMQLIRRHQKAPQKLMVHGYGGALATAGYGTALGVVRAAHSAGLVEQVLVNESRPWLQGARLTAWELVRDGIATRLHVDSAAAHVMQRNSVSWVVVGADRIAANGDVINRIGTYGLSILALHHGLRFMVVASTATIDMTLADGDELSVEERGSSELLQLGERCIDAGAPASNPVSDVTPADLIDAIVTEKGVVERPDARKIADLMSVRRLH